jgi:hypothetical protein
VHSLDTASAAFGRATVSAIRSSIGLPSTGARQATLGGHTASPALNAGVELCIELAELIPEGTVFEVSSEEYDRAAAEQWPDFARLLGIIESITRGEWPLEANNRTSNRWRRA